MSFLSYSPHGVILAHLLASQRIRIRIPVHGAIIFQYKSVYHSHSQFSNTHIDAMSILKMQV